MTEVEISSWKELVLLRQLKTSHNWVVIMYVQSRGCNQNGRLELTYWIYLHGMLKHFLQTEKGWDWNVVIACYWLLAKLFYTFHDHYIILSWLLQLVMCGFIGSWQNYLIVIMIIISYYYDNYLCLHVGAWKVVIAYYWLLATPNLEDNTCSSKENM